MMPDNEFSSCNDVLHVLNFIKTKYLKTPSLTLSQKIVMTYYFHCWKKVFLSLKDDASIPNLFANQQFPLPINFNFSGHKHTLYTRFNIDYINAHLNNLETLTYKDIKSNLESYETPDDIALYQKECIKSGPIVTVSMFFGKNTYIIIDGNHRFHFIQKDNMTDFPVKNIGSHQLNESQFTSKFSFAICFFVNDINYLGSLCSSHKKFYQRMKYSLHRIKNL